ncbi:MAG: hypothetical protein AYK19_21480 [Theionarchaea archaeon DG-70-1]|nr:MAG: hypothetical protein AYK19_21480 [Theionarchaea archaeon DG-70-1]
MKHIVVQDWNKYNRSDRIKSIVAALKRSGKTEVEYFKGRLYLARLLLGKGHPKHVNKDDNWNQVRITYEGKIAINIFDSDFGPDGYFFDENFSEDEIQQINNAFADADVSIQKGYTLRMTWIRLLHVCGALLALLLAVGELKSGDPVSQILPLFLTLGFLILLSRT